MLVHYLNVPYPDDNKLCVTNKNKCIYVTISNTCICYTNTNRCNLLYKNQQNPDIVLVHYLNVPYPDDNKLMLASSISLWADKKEWTKDELICQLKPMCEYSVILCSVI